MALSPLANLFHIIVREVTLSAIRQNTEPPFTLFFLDLHLVSNLQFEFVFALWRKVEQCFRITDCLRSRGGFWCRRSVGGGGRGIRRYLVQLMVGWHRPLRAWTSSCSAFAVCLATTEGTLVTLLLVYSPNELFTIRTPSGRTKIGLYELVLSHFAAIKLKLRT